MSPRKAAYNRVYNRTTRGCLAVLVLLSFGVSVGLVVLIAAMPE